MFAPLAYMSGNTGRLFREFALAVSAAVLVSGFVALSLSPMMCSRMLALHGAHGRLYDVSERVFERIHAAYRRLLATALAVRPLVILFGGSVGAASGVLATRIPSELAPIEDRGTIIGMISGPEGATMAYTDGYARRIETMLAEIPEIAGYFMEVAPGLDRPNPVNSAMAFVSLKPWEERTRKQQDIAADLVPKLQSLPGVLAFSINPAPLGQSFRQTPIQFVIQAGSFQELHNLVSVKETVAAKELNHFNRLRAATVQGRCRRPRPCA